MWVARISILVLLFIQNSEPSQPLVPTLDTTSFAKTGISTPFNITMAFGYSSLLFLKHLLKWKHRCNSLARRPSIKDFLVPKHKERKPGTLYPASSLFGSRETALPWTLVAFISLCEHHTQFHPLLWAHVRTTTEDQPRRGAEVVKPTGCYLKFIPTVQCAQCTLERQMTDVRCLWHLKRRELNLLTNSAVIWKLDSDRQAPFRKMPLQQI